MAPVVNSDNLVEPCVFHHPWICLHRLKPPTQQQRFGFVPLSAITQRIAYGRTKQWEPELWPLNANRSRVARSSRPRGLMLLVNFFSRPHARYPSVILSPSRCLMAGLPAAVMRRFDRWTIALVKTFVIIFTWVQKNDLCWSKNGLTKIPRKNAVFINTWNEGFRQQALISREIV